MMGAAAINFNVIIILPVAIIYRKQHPPIFGYTALQAANLTATNHEKLRNFSGCH
jgi:hypothetical protein